VKYSFIRAHEGHFRVASLCRALKVSRSGFYEWHDRPEPRRSTLNRSLLAKIRRVHAENREAYGAVKTWHALLRQGILCGRHRVARLRKLGGIEAKRKRRFRVMTEHHHISAKAPDLLQRQFNSHTPNGAWVGDMTFIRTRTGWLHLAILIDLFSRRVVGWAMNDRPNETLSLAALEMALIHRGPKPGLIHHTDQGVIYRARSYLARLAQFSVLPSMGGKKSAYDNAVAESFFSNLKAELVHHCDFITRDHARAAIFDYIELFYNRRRIHQSLGYRTPEEVEREWRGS
jgi:putative transposase